MDFTVLMKKKHYSETYIYFPEVLPRLFCQDIYSIAVTLIFTVVLHIFTHDGCKMGACAKLRFCHNLMDKYFQAVLYNVMHKVRLIQA